MAKPVRPFVEREDYEWFVNRFGDDGLPPGKYVLFLRVRDHIEKIDKEIEKLREAQK